MTAMTAIKQLTSSDDMTRTGREVDDDRGEIMTSSFRDEVGGTGTD